MYPSGAPNFTPGLQWGACYSIFCFMCMFSRSLFCPMSFFLLAIVLSVLRRYTNSDYPFGIFIFFILLALTVHIDSPRMIVVFILISIVCSVQFFVDHSLPFCVRSSDNCMMCHFFDLRLLITPFVLLTTNWQLTLYSKGEATNAYQNIIKTIAYTCHRTNEENIFS